MQVVSFLSSFAAVFVMSYLLGSIPNGYLIGKFNGIDIRQHGSHNIGATNVRRVLGRDWSLLCFALDFLKGMVPVWLIGHGLASGWTIGAGLGGLVAAFAAVCGHVFPVWLHFKGGKGVATSLGVVCGLAFVPLVFGVVAWAVAFYSCRRIVAIASMAALVVMAIVAFVMSCTASLSWLTTALIAALAVIVVVRHKENIIRIINGNENSFAKKKQPRA